MLIAGGGGGHSGTTNWYAHDVESMWHLVSNQETENHWRQVSGWDKINELTSTHLSRLKTYRDNLAAAWPPEKSAAARAFIERLDYLIDHIKSVNDVAAANYSTLRTTTSTLSTSRHKLKQIYDEYVKKKKQKQEYEEAVAFSQDSLLPGVSIGKPKVTQADLDELNNRARAIMYDLSDTLVEARVQLRQPPPYKPKLISRDPAGDPGTSGGGYGGSAPPVIPPVVPLPSGGPSTPPPSGPVGPFPSPTAPGPGPILGGTGPIVTPAPTTPPTVITPPSGGPVPGGPYGPGPFPPGAPIPPGPKFLPPNPALPGGAIAYPPGAALPAKPGVGGFTTTPRPMPPGGLIGGPPGAGLRQPAPGASPIRQINPVGGVIGGGANGSVSRFAGGGSATGRLAAGAGQGRGLPPGARTGGRPRDEEELTGKRWDPDNPWETEEGVTPVVQPSTQIHRIDPGPAIGLDR